MVSQQHNVHPTFPRILIVTRRTIRKNKYVDFVGEYHLSLLLENEAIPLLIPRVSPTSAILDAYQPFDGLLLVEGEDIGPAYAPNDVTLSSHAQSHVTAAHPGDVHPDDEKDQIEFTLVNEALAHAIPILAICRGSQLLNVAAGGDLIPDIDLIVRNNVSHIDYSNYDHHRHPIHVIPATPLHNWFDQHTTLSVNSYHHQAISHLASRFAPMAHSPDGLVEAYYDPHCYDPQNGKFVVGLQFHPERMQDSDVALADNLPVYDYPGCPRPYKQFVNAAASYRHNRLIRLQSLLPDIPLRRQPFVSITDQLDNLRKPLSEHTALSNRYSKDDLRRIIRSGGTVHGSSLVLKMLQKENAGNAVTSSYVHVDGTQTHNRSHWKRFQRVIAQAERAFQALTDPTEIEQALSLLEKLSNSCSSVQPDDLSSALSEAAQQHWLIRETRLDPCSPHVGIRHQLS